MTTHDHFELCFYTTDILMLYRNGQAVITSYTGSWLCEHLPAVCPAVTILRTVFADPDDVNVRAFPYIWQAKT